MAEEFPKPEDAERLLRLRETIEIAEQAERRLKLVELLRTKGPEDGETRQLLTEWRSYLEPWAQHPDVGREGEIGLLLKCAALYEEAGLTLEAKAELEDAKQMAYYETEAAQDEATYNKFLELFDEIEARLARLGG